MDNAKVDYDGMSILPESDRRYHYPPETKKKTLTERKDEARMLDEVFANIGIEKKKVNKVQREKKQEEWERLYSPCARARQANAMNTEARAIAAKVRTNLIERGLIK